MKSPKLPEACLGARDVTSIIQFRQQRIGAFCLPIFCARDGVIQSAKQAMDSDEDGKA
jgi:hypothetical protein